MKLRAARQRSVAEFAFRVGLRLSLAALFLLVANDALQNAVAEGDTRTISFHHLHTGENITVTYKRDGRYDEAALKKLDWFMRDWRRNEEVHMDPHLFDLLWEVEREVGSTAPIDVVCGYRSPQTNAMLRERSTGVAQFSQHTHGQAIDFYIPGVPLEKIREVGLWLQRGGVGFYPTSGSPFIHMDTGTIRHWPRIARSALEKIFPDGRTVHIPTDGKPLSGYRTALQEVERHGNVPSEMSLQTARAAGAISESDEEYALELPKQQTMLAGLLGKDEDYATPATGRPAPTAVAGLNPVKPARTVVARLEAPKAEHIVTASITPLPKPAPHIAPAMVAARAVPLPESRPHVTVAAATAPTPEETFVTASLAGTWRGSVEKGPALPAALEVASATPSTTALAFSEETPMPMPAPARLRPMGANLPQLPAEATLVPQSSGATVRTAARLSGGAETYDSPWLRAAMLTPSVSLFMSTSHAGESYNGKALEPLLQKPAMSLAMTFSADPNYGMVADRFSGHAVVFLATATFTRPQLVSMR